MSASVYECHGHALMDGAAYADARRRHADGVDLDAVHRCLAALRDAGVTYFRDGGKLFPQNPKPQKQKRRTDV